MTGIITETERLIIREWCLKDIKALHKVMSDEEVMRYVWDYRPATFEQVEEFVRHCMAESSTQQWTTWPIISKHENILIGYCGFLVRSYGEYKGETEMGWLIDSNYWGIGLATEAARAVLTLGLDKWSFSKVIASAREENTQSVKIMEKIGMSLINPSLNPKGRLVPHAIIYNPTNKNT